MSRADIIAREGEFLTLFGFQMNFVTHYDFYQTYTDKIEKQIAHNLKFAGDGVTQDFIAKCEKLVQKLSEMSLYLVKMGL